MNGKSAWCIKIFVILALLTLAIPTHLAASFFSPTPKAQIKCATASLKPLPNKETCFDEVCEFKLLPQRNKYSIYSATNKDWPVVSFAYESQSDLTTYEIWEGDFIKIKPILEFFCNRNLSELEGILKEEQDKKANNITLEPLTSESEAFVKNLQKSKGDPINPLLCTYFDYQKHGVWLVSASYGREYCETVVGTFTSLPRVAISPTKFLGFLLKEYNPTMTPYLVSCLITPTTLFGLVLACFFYLKKHGELYNFLKLTPLKICLAIISLYIVRTLSILLDFSLRSWEFWGLAILLYFFTCLFGFFGIRLVKSRPKLFSNPAALVILLTALTAVVYPRPTWSWGCSLSLGNQSLKSFSISWPPYGLIALIFGFLAGPLGLFMVLYPPLLVSLLTLGSLFLLSRKFASPELARKVKSWTKVFLFLTLWLISMLTVFAFQYFFVGQDIFDIQC